MWNSNKVLFTLLLLVTSATEAEVTRFMQVSPDFYRCSQPETDQDYEMLKNVGIKTIINVRSDNTVSAAEAMALKHGFLFFNYPLSDMSGEIHREEVKKIFSLLLKSESTPVLLHCKFGKDRTGLITALFRVLIQHWTPEEAFAEWRAMGLSDEWGTQIQDYFWEIVRSEAHCQALLN